MLVVENTKTPTIYTHVGTTQKVSIYINKGSGRYTPRFHVNNYNPTGKKQHGQRSFGSFKSAGAAYKWADDLCNAISAKDAFDVHALKRAVSSMTTTPVIDYIGE
jgi:hypothetical protein|tara:strand:- start:329 stop:643 length:315 start_codon:yes stop_codon:yes gene_type:complete